MKCEHGPIYSVHESIQAGLALMNRDHLIVEKLKIDQQSFQSLCVELDHPYFPQAGHAIFVLTSFGKVKIEMGQ